MKYQGTWNINEFEGGPIVSLSLDAIIGSSEINKGSE